MGVEKTSITTNTSTTKTSNTTKAVSESKKVVKKVGNWFSRNSAKIGQSLSILGTTAMNVGSNFANLEMQKTMLKSASIWGMSGMGMMGMGFFGGRDYSSWYMNGDPLGVSWLDGGYGGYNPYYTQMGAEMAFNWGAQLYQQAAMSRMPIAQQTSQMQQLPQFQQNQQNQQIIQTNQTHTINTQEHVVQELKPENNVFADLDVSKEDTKDGKKFDEATDELQSGDRTKYSLGVKEGDDSEETAANYKERVSKLGKSYVAHIEKKSSDGVDDDGIELEEFKEHELAKLGDNITAAKRKDAEQIAENAFKKFDINNDKKIDWKEYSAAIMTFDQTAGTKPNKNSNDGQITSADYKAWSTHLADSKQNIFDVSIRENYKELFEDSDE